MVPGIEINGLWSIWHLKGDSQHPRTRISSFPFFVPEVLLLQSKEFKDRGNFHKVKSKIRNEPSNIQWFSVFLFLVLPLNFFIGMAKKWFIVTFTLFENILWAWIWVLSDFLQRLSVSYFEVPKAIYINWISYKSCSSNVIF